MREHRPHTRLGARATAILPAECATLGTSLTGGSILVAHTGNAHLGLTVDRRLLQTLAAARALAGRAAPRCRPTGPEHSVAMTEPPAEIYFRRATSYSTTVSGGRVHLTLHATGHRGRPDAHVELLVDDQLLERLSRAQGSGV